MPTCLDTSSPSRAFSCRNATSATHLKLLSTTFIFLTSLAGISFPVVVATSLAGKPLYTKSILLIKSFAAGVILSTSLVHVLPDAFESLSDCTVSSLHPWKDFPFAGAVTLIGALLALLVDLTANSTHAESGEYEKVVEMVEVVVEEERREKERERMVTKVLEIGIIFHSVIIGVTMGMSQNVCSIKPLVVALGFHQVFEGMGLGGCIAKAGFSFKTTAYMCFMFSVTTPVGILLGMIIFSVTGYDDSSANALISEGLLGSLSSGILIYMALVDLISADFFHNKMMSSEAKMKKGCYIALVLGSVSMSILALWA